MWCTVDPGRIRHVCGRCGVSWSQLEFGEERAAISRMFGEESRQLPALVGVWTSIPTAWGIALLMPVSCSLRGQSDDWKQFSTIQDNHFRSGNKQSIIMTACLKEPSVKH